MEDNPYTPPVEPIKKPERPRGLSLPDKATADIARKAQFGLRMIGVYLVSVGITVLIGSVVEGAHEMRQANEYGFSITISSFTYGWFASSISYIAIGMYFIVDGRWVIQSVFLPASASAEDEE